MSQQNPDEILANLRVEIDRIDASMHGLLMERGRIIDRLIEVKGKLGGGSAFRPGREASMMRNLLGRHQGLLPLDTIEGIWRIIIATFTYVQSNFSVHADSSGGDAIMRDSVRFHFGFTVPYFVHSGAASVIEAVRCSDGDLGVVRLDGGTQTGAWWSPLTPPEAPKIIARLPTVARANHPAGLPVFVISKPLTEATSREVVIRAALIDRWTDSIQNALASVHGSMHAAAADGVGLSVLVSTPGDVGEASLQAAFQKAGVKDVRLHEVGSHAAINTLSNDDGGKRDAK